jgi:hypothetical protein
MSRAPFSEASRPASRLLFHEYGKQNALTDQAKPLIDLVTTITTNSPMGGMHDHPFTNSIHPGLGQGESPGGGGKVRDMR